MKSRFLLSSTLALTLLIGATGSYPASVCAGQASGQDKAEEERSLGVTITGSTIEQFSDSLCTITAEIELMNWSLEPISLEEGVSAGLN